ncbi:MAG: hypothetical protein JO036_11420 [Candidatus Eremiobacteraeota bacterium]|nr:hypothetical protein [Candidatus Eremiobacteraeota bacterium]
MAVAQAIRTPQFFGVYALVHGKLVELPPVEIHPGLGGLAFVDAPPSVDVPGTGIVLLVYQREMASAPPDHVALTRLLRMRSQVFEATPGIASNTRVVDVPRRLWTPTDPSISLRVAPVPSKPDMVMLKFADPKYALYSGRWTIKIGAKDYGFNVQDTTGRIAEGCVNDIIQLAIHSLRDCAPGINTPSGELRVATANAPMLKAATQAPWKTFTFERYGFGIASPVELDPVANVPNWFSHVFADQVLLTVKVDEYSATNPTSLSQRIEDEVRSQEHSMIAAEVLNRTPISLGTAPGVDLTVEATTVGKDRVRIHKRVRIYATPSYVYTIESRAPIEQSFWSGTDRFFASFRILPAESSRTR